MHANKPLYGVPRFDVRTILTALALVFVFWLTAHAELPRWEIGLGTFDATELESQECYFQIGSATVVTFHPKSTYCEIARNELRGRKGRLVFIVEEP